MGFLKRFEVPPCFCVFLYLKNHDVILHSDFCNDALERFEGFGFSPVKAKKRFVAF